jgi:DnaJ domain
MTVQGSTPDASFDHSERPDELQTVTVEQTALPADKPTTFRKRAMSAQSDGGIAMENQFNPHRGFDTTTHQNRESLEAQTSSQSGHASPIFSDFQQLLGEGSEPDPLFFIETWTLGTPAAVENFRLRQPIQADRCAQSLGDSTPNYVSSQSFLHANPFNWSVFVSVNTVVSENCDPTHVKQTPIESHPSGADEFDSHDEALPTNIERALRILGVTPTSTLSQIKTAHRQQVITWHPDRLQHKSDEIRRYATQKMAAINEAYRLLRNDLLQHSS